MDDEKQGTFEEISEEYAAFMEKFKPRKTTDDCYTPANIYETVLGWASRRYGFEPGCAVRPFWPGADFRRFDYPPGCVVVDNPPFSILASIARWYGEAGIRYFLFVPGLMCNHINKGMNYVCCGVTVTYDNGAKVCTSFGTNMGECILESAPDLARELEAVDKLNCKAQKKKVRKLELPDAVATAARMNYLASHGIRFQVRRGDGVVLHDLKNCKIFGSCVLLSERAAAERAAAERAATERAATERAAAERAAAERAAAERAAAERVELSREELSLQKGLGGRLIG